MHARDTASSGNTVLRYAASLFTLLREVMSSIEHTTSSAYHHLHFEEITMTLRSET
jgi:hypothetical protein